MVKLAPLARLEDETINKMVENLEALARLSLKDKEDERLKKGGNQEPGQNNAISSLLFSCKNISDITRKFQEFEFEKEAGGVVCCVCSAQESSCSFAGLFKYQEDNNSELGRNQSMKFRHLKQHLKDHLNSVSHKKLLEILTNKSKVQLKEESRNQAVALRIGRVAYFLLKTGRPDTDFVSLLYLHSANGSDVGDLNHSANFPPKFLRHVY